MMHKPAVFQLAVYHMFLCLGCSATTCSDPDLICLQLQELMRRASQAGPYSVAAAADGRLAGSVYMPGSTRLVEGQTVPMQLALGLS